MYIIMLLALIHSYFKMISYVSDCKQECENIMKLILVILLQYQIDLFIHKDLLHKLELAKITQSFHVANQHLVYFSNNNFLYSLTCIFAEI